MAPGDVAAVTAGGVISAGRMSVSIVGHTKHCLLKTCCLERKFAGLPGRRNKSTGVVSNTEAEVDPKQECQPCSPSKAQVSCDSYEVQSKSQVELLSSAIVHISINPDKISEFSLIGLFSLLQ